MAIPNSRYFEKLWLIPNWLLWIVIALPWHLRLRFFFQKNQSIDLCGLHDSLVEPSSCPLLLIKFGISKNPPSTLGATENGRLYRLSRAFTPKLSRVAVTPLSRRWSFTPLSRVASFAGSCGRVTRLRFSFGLGEEVALPQGRQNVPTVGIHVDPENAKPCFFKWMANGDFSSQPFFSMVKI